MRQRETIGFWKQNGMISKWVKSSKKNQSTSFGVGIAAGWDAVAPNFRTEKRKEGLLIHLTFPAYEPEQIKWGISKLREVEEMFL
jgi:hypothetical protein